MTDLIDIDQASKFLNLAIQTIYNKVSARQIPFVKLGRKLLFDPEKLKEWANENSYEPLKGYRNNKS